MATVTGKLKDFENDALSGHPVLQFTPTGPGVGDALYADKTVRIRDFGQNGTFTVNLIPTFGLIGRVKYRMSVIYLDDAGNPLGYSEWPYAFTVPDAGGDLKDLAVAVVDSDTVYTSPDVNAASDPDVFTGYKMNTVTGDLYERRPLA